MRRRKQNDKRVLKSRYSQPPKQKRRMRNNSRNRNYYRPKKQSKTSKTTLLIVILALIAFVAGAGAGVSMALGVFEENSTNETHVENVTVQMTSNLNETSMPVDQYDGRKIDYNNRSDVEQYNLTNLTVTY